jgi:hypothetical protein
MSNVEEVMVRQCPVAVSVSFIMTDLACQSYGKPSSSDKIYDPPLVRWTTTMGPKYCVVAQAPVSNSQQSH